ncbi:hypothetical protein Q3G72_016373 [Acer saccharum]|nr:hypothetical protein Q3G72_016373 [Acer saccharum]
MARLFRTDQIQSITSGLAGTFGYMAPEYVKEGRISMKSDVYSFGILQLMNPSLRLRLQHQRLDQALMVKTKTWSKPAKLHMETLV